MPKTDLNRRQFARTLAAGAVSGAVVSTSSAAVTNKDAVAADKPPLREEKDAETTQADHTLAIIRARYPDRRLTPDVLHEIKLDIEADQRRARVLRTVPLTNGDEPGFVFAAYRSDAIR